MYLKSIHLRHWGCHDDLPIAFDEGLNICIGPNGVGKSTLYHAIVIALTVKHDATNQRVAAFRSWGRDGFGPTASLEIVRVDGVWSLTKTYLNEPRCLLEGDPASKASLKAKGKVAEQHLEGWLASDGAAGRLFLTLWSDQNDPIPVFQTIPGVKPPPAGSLLENVLAKAARAEAAGPFASLKRAVAEQYGERFTPQKMAIKTGSDLDLARKLLDEARCRLDELQSRRGLLTEKVEAYKRRAAAYEEDCHAREGLRRQGEAREGLGREYQAKAEALKQAEQHAAELRERYESLQSDHARLKGAEDALAEESRKLAALEPELARARSALDAAEGALKIVERRQQEARPLLDDLATCFELRSLLTEARQKVQARRAGEEQARRCHEEAGIALRQAQERLQTALGESERTRRALDAARLARARRELREAEETYRRIEAESRCAHAARLAAERETLRERLGRLREWSDALVALDPAGDGGPVPSPEEWRALQDEDRCLATLAATLDSDALTVRLAAEAPIKARIAADGQSSNLHELTAGQVVEGRGVGAFSIVIEGVGRIDVGRGAGEPSDLMEQLRRGRAALAARLSEWRAASVADLERRLRRAERRRVLEERIAVQLGGLSLPDLESRLTELDGALRDLGLRTDDPVPPLPSGPGLHVLGRRLDEARQKLAVARAACEDGWADGRPEGVERLADPAEAAHLADSALLALKAAEERLKTAQIEPARTEANLKNARGLREEAERLLAEASGGLDPDQVLADLLARIQDNRSSLEALDAAPQGVETRGSVQVVQERLNAERGRLQRERGQALEHWTALNSDHRIVTRIRDDRAASLRQLREALRLDADPKVRCATLREREEQWRRAEAAADLRRDALPPDPAADCETLEDRRRQVEDRCREGELRLAELRAELATMGADGLDSQVVLAQELLDHRKARVDDLQRDASAWALLHHLLDEEETRQSHDVAARIQALATGTVIQLTGGNAQGVAFDPKTLAPVEAQVPCHGFRARLEQFSRGTREQVALACRLQIGILLSQERQRHMLLLDDPLAHTDARRLKAAFDVLVEVSKDLQLIIFTCHEDRYRALGDAAKFIPLG